MPGHLLKNTGKVRRLLGTSSLGVRYWFQYNSEYTWLCHRDVVFDNRAKKAKILGNYVMGDVLGEGSYAKVKEAVDRRSGH